MTTKILIVDDYLDTLSIYRELFEMQGYEVLTATSGDEAALHMQDAMPELLIVDDDPQEESGVRVVARLKRIAMERTRRSVPAIAIRGDFYRGDPPVMLGFEYVLGKPLGFERLGHIVRHASGGMMNMA